MEALERSSGACPKEDAEERPAATAAEAADVVGNVEKAVGGYAGTPPGTGRGAEEEEEEEFSAKETLRRTAGWAGTASVGPAAPAVCVEENEAAGYCDAPDW